MKIKSLRAPAFKGRDIDENFESVNLVIGKNFEGKSAIAQAIQVALYGCLPSLGETNAITMQLSSHDKELYTRVTFDDGTSNALALSRSDSGIKRSFDESHAIPRVMIDVQEYFELNGQERLDYVLKRVNVKKCGYDERVFREKLFAPNLIETQLKTFEIWNETFKTMVRQRENTNSSIMEWMESLLLRLKSAKSAADQKVKGLKPQILALETSLEIVPDDVSRDRDKALEKLSEARAAVIVKDNSKIDDLDDKLNAARKNVTDLKGDISECEADESRMRRYKCCPTCKAKGVDWLKSWLEENEQRKKPLESALKGAQDEVRTLEKQLTAAREQLTKPDKQQLKLQQAVDNAQERLDELEELHDKRRSWENDRERMRKLGKEMIEVSNEAQTLKGMIENLVDYQSQIVVKAFTLLLKTARRFTDGILRGNLEYVDGELGYYRGTLFVRHRTFSGTEQLLAYSGLQIALAQESPVKMAIFDEMGRVREDLCSVICKRVIELVEDGTLDQAILIDTTVERYKSYMSKIHLIQLR